MEEIDTLLLAIQPDDDLRKRMRDMLEKCRSTEKEKYVYVWRGVGNNGKTTLARALKESCSQIKNFPIELITGFRESKDNLISLVGDSRCLIIEEDEVSRKLSASGLSIILGFTSAKVIIITNERELDVDDAQFRHKIKYFDFPVVFDC